MSLPFLCEVLQQNNLFAWEIRFVSFSIAWEGLTLRIMGLSGKSAVEEKSKPAAKITWPSWHLIRIRKMRARAKVSPAYRPLSSSEPQKNKNLRADAGRFSQNIDMAPFYFCSRRKKVEHGFFFLCCFLIYMMVPAFLLFYLFFSPLFPTLWPLRLLLGVEGQVAS